MQGAWLVQSPATRSYVAPWRGAEAGVKDRAQLVSRRRVKQQRRCPCVSAYLAFCILAEVAEPRCQLGDRGSWCMQSRPATTYKGQRKGKNSIRSRAHRRSRAQRLGQCCWTGEMPYFIPQGGSQASLGVWVQGAFLKVLQGGHSRSSIGCLRANSS